MTRRSSRQGPIVGPYGGLIEELNDILGRIAKLEAPSGESLANVVPRLEKAIAELNVLVNGAVQVPAARATDLSTAEDRAVAWISRNGLLGHT